MTGFPDDFIILVTLSPGLGAVVSSSC